MGRDIYIRIVYQDPEEGWREIKLYTKKNNEIKEIDPYPYRNHELFDLLSEEEDFPSRLIYKKNLPKSIVNEIEEFEKDFINKFYEVNLADLKIYIKNHPTIVDYEAEWEDIDKKKYKENPIIPFINIIEQYIDFAEPFWDWNCVYSNVRIIYWFA